MRPAPFILLLLNLLAISATAQQPAASDGAVADFERGSTLPKLSLRNLGVATETDRDEQNRYLRLTPSTPEADRAFIRITLPLDVRPHNHAALSGSFRVPASDHPVKLRWLALDETGHPIFHRRFELNPGDEWIVLEHPLQTMHWDTRRVGDWDEVREIVLRVDSADAKRIDIDDIRFVGTARDEDRIQWLLGVAFADRDRKFVAAEGLMVATDAINAFSDADLRRLLEDMQRTRAFLRRVFGDAVRPIDDLHSPAALLIFAHAEEYPGFFNRLGEEWGATISPPTGQGQTVQDIAASTYRADLGTRRPVYLHESAHAVVARDLRLLTGHPPHRPLQEGIASYLQICVFPESIDRVALAKNFKLPIDQTGKGFLKPLEMLFTQPVTTREYAQLATLIAYLIDQEPELLVMLAKGLAEGGNAGELLESRGVKWEQLQVRWQAWCRKTIQPDAAANERVFELPREFH